METNSEQITAKRCTTKRKQGIDFIRDFVPISTFPVPLLYTFIKNKLRPNITISAVFRSKFRNNLISHMENILVQSRAINITLH
jgi:hypothetical protein